MDTLVFAYYCSGHGYGHATRVSAFARHLLSLPLPRRLTVHIVSSAPRHVFADSIACGALYRYADIDPVIVQPLAYRVDRQKSVKVLEDFLGKKDAMLDRERSWLTEIGANCVLSDAAFLGCYLATSLVDSPAQTSITPSSSALSPSPSTATDASISSTSSDELSPDIPIPGSTLAPLVSQLHEGYQHADSLLRLPGHIPIPSFLSQPALPSPQWVDPILNKFHDSVTHSLLSTLDSNTSLHLPKPFPNGITIPRSVRTAPLLVRPPSPYIYTPEGRADFLKKTGLPDFPGMKILVVSFGGQLFKRPGSRTGSRMQSRFPSQEALTSVRPTEKKASNKQSPRDHHNLPTTSTSMDGLVLKPRDMNASVPGDDGLRLDLNAIDKGLRTHIKSKSSDAARRHTSRTGTSYCSDENVSDYASSDADNGGTSSHAESDLESLSNKGTRVQFPFETTTINALGPTPVTAAAANLSKRRHTLPRRRHHSHDLHAHRRCLATPSHLLIPGAPPASKPAQTIMRTPSLGKSHGNSRLPGSGTGREEVVKVPEMCVIPPTPRPSAFGNTAGISMETKVESLSRTSSSSSDDSVISPTSTATSQTSTYTDDIGDETEVNEEDDVGLLPDESWIAVICGVSKEQWNAENEEGGLPEGFYVAPRDVYMPDLIAVGNVVLGKLGYGMTSECVDACTPFVYVSRPLFIEEHGLRMYLDQEGVGVELSRSGYEGGEWANSVQEAYCKGWEMKEAKRRKEYDFCMKLEQLDKEGVKSDDERRLSERERQGRDMARGVVEWVDKFREEMKIYEEKKALEMCLSTTVSLPTLSPLEREAKGIMVA
ncbi:hypothetical protein NP233_g6085 [Leucocoprinus birnbaumii]|uniref:L-arabinokinase n=1 Tax=Leucocoprinus birnbaumii TaxID=56174 RepID=A0AAD5VRT1_9AGAR|nr:hypothetical protein NP233_g6085 [Leucocoprinus birnbaumii]